MLTTWVELNTGREKSHYGSNIQAFPEGKFIWDEIRKVSRCSNVCVGGNFNLSEIN